MALQFPPSPRLTFLAIFAVALVAILIALYMQHGMGLYPCPLCITQRVFVIAVGLVALLAFAVNPRATGRRVFAGLGLLLCIVGGGVSSRQVYLQHLPEDQVPACGPDLEYLLNNFPLLDALDVLFRGDGNCAEVDWTLFGLSIAGQTLILFICLAAVHIYQLLRRS